MSVSGPLDLEPTTILVDGVETRVSFSPTRTRVVAAVPTDVKPGSITRALQKEQFNYRSLQTGAGAGDIDNLARQLAALQTTSEAATTARAAATAAGTGTAAGAGASGP